MARENRGPIPERILIGRINEHPSNFPVAFVKNRLVLPKERAEIELLQGGPEAFFNIKFSPSQASFELKQGLWRATIVHQKFTLPFEFRDQQASLYVVNKSVLELTGEDEKPVLYASLDGTISGLSDSKTKYPFDQLVPGTAAQPVRLTPLRVKLSDREREVLQALTDGLKTRQAADKLSITPATLNTHIKSILVKTEARSRFEAVILGLMSGDTQMPQDAPDPDTT